MATMTTLPFKYVRPIYVVVAQDLPELGKLYDMIMKKRNSASNQALRKTESGRQLIASIARGLNSTTNKMAAITMNHCYRVSIDQGQKSLDWRQYPNIKNRKTVKAIIGPMVDLGWLKKTKGHQGKKMADMFYAPEGSPLRVDWSYEKLEYSPLKLSSSSLINVMKMMVVIVPLTSPRWTLQSIRSYYRTTTSHRSNNCQS